MTSPESMLKLQMQVRQNAADIHDYLKDLDNWESEVKKTDNTFKQMNPKPEKRLPPPRSKTVRPSKESSKSLKPKKKLKSYDYRSWDKLDVDKMMEEMDEEDEKAEEEHAKQIEESTEQDLKEEASKEKAQGNNHFKNERYDKAIECYTRGMQKDPNNAVLPANRAMAFLKLGKYLETEADCTLSLSLDPGYTKAYLRRGKARKELSKVESAIRDFKDVLKLEPENKQAKIELEQMETASNKSSKENRESSKKEIGLVRPIQKLPHQRSKKPLRRIAVQEVGNKIEIMESNDTEAPNNQSATLRLNETNSTSPASSRKADLSPISVEVSTKCVAESATAIPPAPKTFYQMQGDLRNLRGSAQACMTYLLQIESDRLPELVKEQINTDTLNVLLQTFCSTLSGHEDFVLSFLTNLSKLKRFDMAVMFFSAGDKKCVAKVFQHLSNHFGRDSVKDLASKFGIS